ncbi:MAG TPA: triple tyrosine motif-containing protein, partial [Niastella sp.]
DRHNTVWIGTASAGLWKLEKGRLSQATFIKNVVYGMSENETGLLFRTEDGLVSYSNGRLQKNPAVKEYINNVFGIGKDSLLVAKQFGIALLKDTTLLPYRFPLELQRTNSSAFAKTKEKIFIGTIGEGIFVWDRTTGVFDRVTTAQGLATNIIYSLMLDKQGQLWAGTGKGISRLVSTDHFHTIAVHNYGRDQGFNGLECNGNAIACWPDNTMWFGTTEGIYAYHPEEDRPKTGTPQLVLQSVKRSGNNHISFEFRCISFAYNNLRYSYFLQGLDNNFTVPDFTNSIAYPSLPPGKYTFKVKTIDETGKQLGNIVTYSFSILPAFYQTFWFKTVLTAGFIGLVYLFYIIRRNRMRTRQALVEKLRLEEQNKIRKKTSQDFHDEMGNKLARIIVLSEILKTKLPHHDEGQALAQKILDNVALLYRGTKDIIWSLNPENDNLQYLLLYINNIGIDFFVDIGIEFEPIPIQAVFSQYYLPMDYSRNIIMICKEAFTNICKHAQCSKVTADAELIDPDTVRLTIADNGKSFDTTGSYNGNGLANIKQRVRYLDGDMQLQSEPGKGTRLTIIFTIPPLRYKKKFNENLVTHP